MVRVPLQRQPWQLVATPPTDNPAQNRDPARDWSRRHGDPPPGTWLLVVILLLTILSASGCGYVRLGRYDPPAGRQIVVHVAIEGNDEVSASDLTEGLATHSENFDSFDDKPLLNPVDVADDYARIVAAFMDNGHFSGRVLDHRVEEDADDPRLVRVIYRVEEGPATRVTAVSYKGFEPPEDPEAAKRIKEVEDERDDLVALEVGDTWTQKGYQAGAESIRQALHKRGFIYAEVVGSVAVSRKEQTAAVEYGVVPGPLARISGVEVQNTNVTTPERIMRRVELEVGSPVNPTRLRETEEDIMGLGVFLSVTAKPRRVPLDRKLEGKAATYENLRALEWERDVVITITVQERPIHELTTGGGLSIDSKTSEFRLIGKYTNRNLAGGQRYFNVSLVPSYWLKPNFFDIAEHGPGGEAEITFRQPAFFEEYLTLETAASYEVDISDARRAHEVGARLGFSRTFWRQLTAYIGYEVSYEAPYEVNTAIVAGQNLSDDKVLTYFEQRLEWDRRDSVLDPRNGWSTSLVFRESLPALGSAADFVYFKSELRGYWQPWKYLGFAARAHWSMNIKISAEDDPPYSDWITGGGATDMRGYAAEEMGPFACDGNIRDVGEAGCAAGETVVRDGGNAKALFSFETRIFLPYDFGLVFFTDVGQIWTFVERTDFDTLDVAIGPGLRYYTIIGPIGLDFGFLLTGANPEKVVVHINIGQSF